MYDNTSVVGKWIVLSAKNTLTAAPTFDSPQAVQQYIEEEVDPDTVYFILRIEDVVIP